MRYRIINVIRQLPIRVFIPVILISIMQLPVAAQCSFTLFGNPVDKIICRGGDAQLGVFESNQAISYEFSAGLRKIGGPLDGSGGSLSVEAPVNSANSAGYYTILARQGVCTYLDGFNVYYGDIDDLSIYAWGSNSVSFRWASSGQRGYVRYSYAVSTESNGDNVFFDDLSYTYDTSADVSDLIPGEQYYIHVKVEDATTGEYGSGSPVSDECYSGRQWYSLAFKTCAGTAPVGLITPLDPVLCAGENLTLNASSGSTFQWYRNGSSLGTTATSSSLVINQPGNYSVYITTAAGCEGMAYSKYIVSTTTTPGVLTGGGNYCTGEIFRLGISGTKTSQEYEIRRNGVVVVPFFTGIGSHLSSFDPVTFELLPRTDTMWFNFTMGPGMDGTYTVNTKNGSCQPVSFGNAVIGKLSAGTISPASAVICLPGSQVLTATGGGTYQWKRNGIPVGTPSASPSYTATQDGVYSVDITNGSCTSPASNTAVITVSAPFGSITPASGAICPGGSIILSASGGTMYQWFRNGVAQGPASASATFTATQTGTYSVIISIGSCSAPGTNQVQINAASSPAGSIIPASATICVGETQMLTASGGNSYEWFRNGISLGPASASSTYSATLGGTYTVTIFNDGCSGPASNNAVITVTPLPSGNITPLSAAFCTGGSQVLTASGGDNYEWFINGVSQGSSSPSPTFTATIGGNYTVRITAGNCSAFASNSVVVTVNSLPAGAITPASGSFCPGGSIILTASGGSTYEWFRDGVSQGPASPSSTFTAIAPGIYTAIINNGTCSGPASNNAIITETAVPAGNITPLAATVCAGGSVQFTATGGITYEWFLNGISQGPPSPSATFNASVAGEYSVILSSGGCTAAAANTSQLTVTPLPSGIITPASASVCAGSSRVLTATGGNSYEWFLNGVSLGPSSPAPTYNATLAGVYTVNITNGNCTGPAANQSVITVTALPAGNITPVNPEICTGSSQVFTATGGTSYEWFLNGVSQGPASPSSTFVATNAGSYSVIITSGQCSGPASNISTLSHIPLPAGAITPASATICAGQSQALTASGGSSYEWFLNGVSQGPSSPSPVFMASVAGAYSAIITSNGCSGPASNTSVISVTPLPTGNITPSSAAICAGSSQVLTASGGVIYEWFRNGISLAPPSASSTYTATLAGTYSVIITNNNCSAPAANNVEITVNPLPSGNINPTLSTICPGSVTQLTANGGVNYQWYLDATAITSATSATYDATEQGVYTVQVIDANGCRKMASNFSTVNFYSKPSASFTTNINCEDQPVTFINSSSSVNSGGVGYLWDLGDNTTSALVTPVHTYTQAGTFTITLIATSATCPLLADTVKLPLVINPAIPGITYPHARVVKNVPSLISARDIGHTYVWQPPGGLSNPAIRTPMVTISGDMVYRIRITSSGGCITVDTLTVQAFANASVFVPKAFTPNGNNANDLLRPILVNIPTVHFFRVYNRWGQLVYQTQTPGEGWNGIYKNTPQPMETYTWSFEGKDLDGNLVRLNGKSLLIR